MGPKIILAVLALLHIGFGVWAMVAPEKVAAMVELQPLTAGATGEVRAVYGGLVFALGLAIARGAFGGVGAGPWVAVVALAYAGMASGRLISLLSEGASGYTLLAMGFEGLLAAFLGWSATQVGQPRGTSGAAAPKPPPPPVPAGTGERLGH